MENEKNWRQCSELAVLSMKKKYSDKDTFHKGEWVIEHLLLC